MTKSEFDLNLPEENINGRWLVYFKIIFTPAFIYLLFWIGYFYNFAVDILALCIMSAMLGAVFVFSHYSTEYACFLFEQRIPEFKRSLKEFIIKSMLTIGNDTKSNANLEEFLSEYSKTIRVESVINMVAGVFALLGVLGSFISLGINLPNLAQLNGENFEFELGKFLSTLGTSFSISIYGIALALWWIFFERYSMLNFSRLINRQRLATKSFFWNKDEIEKKYMQEALANFSKISTIFGFVSNKEFFVELDRAVEKKFSNFSNMLRIESEAVKLSGEQLRHTMQNLQRSQKEQRDIVRIHSEILSLLQAFSQQMKEVQANITSQHEKLREMNDKKITKLETCIENTGKIVENFEKNLQIFSEEILDKQKLMFDDFKTRINKSLQEPKQIYAI